MLTFILLSVLVYPTIANAYKHFESLKLKAGDTMNIWPVTNECNSESRWNFEACEGCKIVLACALSRRNCADHMLTVFNGKWTTRHCGPSDSHVLKTSLKNWMNVIIENNGLKPGSYCRVSVTKPYYNAKHVSTDSSEHGIQQNMEGTEIKSSCKCGWKNKTPAGVVGGQDTNPIEYPFAAQLMLKKRNYPYCGGSILTPYHILSAAHCTHPFQGVQISVIIGKDFIRTNRDTSLTKIIDVEKVYEHPSYDNRTNIFDISILKLRQKIIFNENVGPVCLPKASNVDLLNEYVKVLGWGQPKYNEPKSQVIRKVNLKVIDLDICKTMYGTVDTKKRTQICTWAPGKNSCEGDSGGPLLWRDPKSNRFSQVGIVSFSTECGNTDPGINTDVSFFIDWIQQIISATKEEICHQ